ncbi:MAG TPA: hypothetical protein VGP31_07975 [Planosporangium sp.]|nr:hypothetical protein [Planosporangium sp.]
MARPGGRRSGSARRAGARAGTIAAGPNTFDDIHHVAMYAGDGRVIQAPQTGEQISIRQTDVAPIFGYGRVS